MVTRKTTAFAFIAILITAWLVFFVTQMEAQTPEDQKQALIGEWSGIWKGEPMEYPGTLIIHEIDTAKAKVRCTYGYYSAVGGEMKEPVLADFIPGPNPKIEFKKLGQDFKFVLEKTILQGSKSMLSGSLKLSTIKMEKNPKK